MLRLSLVRTKKEERKQGRRGGHAPNLDKSALPLLLSIWLSVYLWLLPVVMAFQAMSVSLLENPQKRQLRGSEGESERGGMERDNNWLLSPLFSLCQHDLRYQ